MKKLVLALSLIFSSTAMANTLECLPFSKNGSAANIASKAFFNQKENTITVILNSEQAVSESLVDASNLGRGAVAFSEDATARTGLNVTVIPSAGRTYVVVSPFMSMSLPQQLLCK